MPCSSIHPDKCAPIGEGTVCIKYGCPHWDADGGCMWDGNYKRYQELRNMKRIQNDVTDTVHFAQRMEGIHVVGGRVYRLLCNNGEVREHTDSVWSACLIKVTCPSCLEKKEDNR